MDFVSFVKWVFSTALACLSFAGWALALVNTSLLHEDCGTEDVCDRFFRRYWWTIVFQFAIMLNVFAIWFSGAASKARAAIIGFLALVTVQHIELAGKLLTAIDDKTGWPTNKENADEWVDDDTAKADMTGFTLLAFTNMVYMLIFGSEELMGTQTSAATIPEKKETAETTATSP